MAARWATLMPNWEWRHRCRAYSSWKSTLSRLMGWDVNVLMLPPPKAERPHQPAEDRGQQSVERPPQDFRNRRTHRAHFPRRHRERRRDLQDVRLVLAKAHQHRIASVPEHAEEVEPEQPPPKPPPRAAGRIQFDANQQPVNPHLADGLAGAPPGEQPGEQGARLGDTLRQTQLLG